MSATCPRCGGAATMLLTSIACDACDRIDAGLAEMTWAEVTLDPADDAPPVEPTSLSLTLQSYDEMWKGLLPPSTVSELAKLKNPFAKLKKKGKAPPPDYSKPPPAAMRMRSAACPLCGNPASVLTVDFGGVAIPITACQCTPINGGVFVVSGYASIQSEHPGRNGVARLDDEQPAFEIPPESRRYLKPKGEG